MISWIDTAALLFAVNAVFASLVIVTRRVMYARAAKARGARRKALEPLAMAVMAGEPGAEAQVEELGRRDRTALAESLSRYARQLTGPDIERIATLLERTGDVAHSIRTLRFSFRSWKRARAAYVLGHIGSREAIEPLVEALRADRSRDVRSSAARSLGRLHAGEAAEALVRCLAERSVPRAVAGQALLSIGPAALPGVLSLTHSEDADLRAIAAMLSGLLGDPRVEEHLLPLLRDEAADVRASAARALGRLAVEAATNELRQRLSDPVPSDRSASARALGQIGNREAVPDLLLTAQEPGFEAAREAADAISRLDPGALPDAGDSEPHLAEARDRVATGILRPIGGYS